MVITHVGNAEYVGASGDVKPVSGISQHSVLRFDNGDVFRFGSSGWGFIGNVSGQFKLQSGSTLVSPSISGVVYPTFQQGKYTVWESGGTLYQTLNNDTGVIVYSGSNAYDAIGTGISGVVAQANRFLLQDSGRVQLDILDGTYVFGSGFVGWSFADPCRIEMGRQAKLKVPGGYSGYVFQLNSGCHYLEVDGGHIAEQSAGLSRDYTAIHILQASGSQPLGIAFNTFSNMVMRGPGHAVRFEITDADGWCNGNAFTHIGVNNPKRYITFDTLNGLAGGAVNRNLFFDWPCQSASGITRAGIDASGLLGSSNIFIDLKFWDLAGSGVYSCHIGSSGINSIIIGGIVTYRDYFSSGANTMTMDQWNGFSTNGTMMVKTIDVSGQANVFRVQNSASGAGANGAMAMFLVPSSGNRFSSVSLYNGEETERFLFQKTSTAINFISQATLAGGSILPQTFQMLDSVNNTTIEPLRLTTSGVVEFNRSGGGIAIGAGCSGITFSGLQRLPFMDEGDYVIWRSGSLVQAVNRNTGIIEYSGTNELSGIMHAFYNISNSTAGTQQKGGIIFLKRGIYNVSGEIAFVGSSGSDQNVIFRGEGHATHIRHTASGYGIRINDQGAMSLEHFKIVALTSGTTHVIHVENGSTRSTITKVRIEGVSNSGIGPRGSEESGQVGIFFANDSTAIYQWQLNDVILAKLDVGIYLGNTDTNGANQNFFSNTWLNGCQIGFKVHSVMNMFSNTGVQGTASAGLWGIQLMSGAFFNSSSNLSTEMLLSGGHALVQDPGAIHNAIGPTSNSQTQQRVILSGKSSVFAVQDYRVGLATTATSTAGNSGAFGPAGWVEIQVSGVLRKMPYFAV